MTYAEPVSEPSPSLTNHKLLHVIVNPASGNGRGAKRLPQFAAKFRSAGYTCNVEYTTGPGDASRLAAEFARAGAHTILAIGGDGTANEIINGLIEGDQPVNPNTRLALVPCGTGKDLSRSLGTLNVDQTLQAIKSNEEATIDVARMSFIDAATREPVTRYFANVADVGFGADVANRTNSAGKAFGATIPYLVNIFKTVAAFQGSRITVEVDGELFFEGDSLMVVFANGRFHAGGMRLAPDASLQDGLLDVYILEKVGRAKLIGSLLPRVYIGKHGGQAGVHYLRGKQVKVETDEPLLVEMDGEQPGKSPVSVAVVPGVLKVIASGSAIASNGRGV